MSAWTSPGVQVIAEELELEEVICLALQRQSRTAIVWAVETFRDRVECPSHDELMAEIRYCICTVVLGQIVIHACIDTIPSVN
jgi:hypothetical protein